MRFLFVAYPLLGHVNPLLSIATSIKAKGHDVAVYTEEAFAQIVTAAGMTFCQPIAWTGINAKVPIKELAKKSNAEMGKVIIHHKILGSVLHSVQDIEHYIQTLNIQMVVQDLFMPGGGLAAERAGVPWASYQVGPVPAREAYKVWMPESVWPVFDAHDVRQQLALSPQPGNLLGLTSPFCHLIPATPTFVGDEDLPDHYHCVGPPVPPLTTEVPDWVSTLADAPAPILVAASSNWGVNFFHRKDDLILYIRSVIDGLVDEPVTVIITLPQDDPEAFTPLPPHMRIEKFVPHVSLMPFLKATVTNGGWGISGQTLTYGVPTVVVPLLGDQPANAARCQELGLGIALDLDDLTPEKMRSAVLQVLNDPGYHQRAQAEAAAIKQIDPTKAVVDSLEGLLEKSLN